MDQEYITRLIYEYNPHIKGLSIEIPEFKRELRIYYQAHL